VHWYAPRGGRDVRGKAAPDLAKAKDIANQVCAAYHAADGNNTAPANPKIAARSRVPPQAA
jgi:cytochrome c553